MTQRTARPQTLPNPYQVLRDHGLRAKKSLGQNFLVDPNIPPQIASSGGLRHGDVVFEIGAGCGTLTHCLGDLATQVIAIEYDEDLAPIAQAELAYASHVDVRHQDVRDLNWSKVADEVGQPLVIYGNLPYYLSSEILLSLLANPTSWKRACFLVQLEFAQRVCATPGNRKAGSISALTHLLTYPSMLFEVPPSAFSPPPKVTSAVMVLERRDGWAEDVGDLKTFRRVVRALFAQRRKMARSALRGICEHSEELLTSLGLTPTTRGERFTLAELARISRALSRPTATDSPSEHTSDDLNSHNSNS
jgi:16S rRNA (adenine1518-N6/adenine1519-N6)-dimethyltransferase